MSNDKKSIQKTTTWTWDDDAITKARAQHKYAFIDDHQQKVHKFKLLSGSTNAWNPSKGKAPTLYCYLPEKRLMGLREPLINFLKSQGCTDAEIKTLFKSAYTRDSQSPEYVSELEALNAYRSADSAQKKDKIKYGLDDLAWFMDALKDAKEEPINKTYKASKASPKSKREIFKALFDKAQSSGQIIDVSNLDTSGAKLRTKSNKSSVHADDLTFMETDNLKPYKKAIEWAFGSTDGHEAEIESIKTKLAEKKKGGNKQKGIKKPAKESGSSDKSVTDKKSEAESTSVAAVPLEAAIITEKPTKKKQMGSPRKAALPGTRSPGAVTTKGGDNFSQIPPLSKVSK